MRLSYSFKVGLLHTGLMLLVIGASSSLLIFRGSAQRERALVAQDRKLAQILAGLRSAAGQLDFATLSSFVDGSDKIESGLVYAIQLDERGKLVQGALNPRLFASIHPNFALQVRQGRQLVLARLAAGELERGGLIKEYSLPVPEGVLRLGFDLQRIEALVNPALRAELLLLLGSLLCGALGALALAWVLTRPLRRLAAASEAAARGELHRPLSLSGSGELPAWSRSLNQLSETRQELRRLQDLFSRYLGAQVAERLSSQKNPLEMGVEERAVSVLSLSLCGFGSLARRLGPREAMRLLNEFLPAVLDAVDEQQGTVILLDGERVRAVWGAPQDVSDPELRAVRAALAARDAVARQSRVEEAAGGAGLQLRAAVCTGRSVAGNAGAAGRLAYQVLGGAADLAANAELLARPGQVLISETTYTKVQARAEARAVNPLILEELDEAIVLYQLDRLR